MITKVDTQKVLDEMAFVKSDPNNKVTQHLWEGPTLDGYITIGVSLTVQSNDKVFNTIKLIF